MSLVRSRGRIQTTHQMKTAVPKGGQNASRILTAAVVVRADWAFLVLRIATAIAKAEMISSTACRNLSMEITILSASLSCIITISIWCEAMVIAATADTT